MLVFLVFFILLLAAYAMSLRPNHGRQARMRPFEDVFIAHRGLHNNRDIPENSLKAFAAAVQAGYGIELDVQLTTDDRLVVFHDETLARVCADERKLHDLSFPELQGLKLLGTDERIPLLSEVLELVGGAVPLIIEIKWEGRYLQTARLTAELLRAYPGLYCVESFHPLLLRWYKKNSPDTLRGQLSTNYGHDNIALPWWTRFLLTNLMMNFLSCPDFIAYNHLYKKQLSYRLCRRLYHPVDVAWTLRSPQELEAARDTFSVYIFEGFTPRK